MADIKESGIVGTVPFVKLGGCGNYSVQKTFDCGQCFRFSEVRSKHNYAVGGVAYGKYVIFAQDTPDDITIYGATDKDFESIWKNYLALNVDYDDIDRAIENALAPPYDCVMRAAVEASRGIRILRQEPFETLCSFIISQNNNIPRIKKIVAAMCEKYGSPISVDSSKIEYAFPTAEALVNAGEEGIFALKTGFRAKYILDCAEKIASGNLNLNEISTESSYEKSKLSLMSVKGVGEKVASCALLFGFGKTEAFPIDVWIRRIIDTRFGGSLDHTLFGKNAGIAQQYMFYYERYIQSHL